MAIEWTAEHIRTMKTSALIACLADPANTFLADMIARAEAERWLTDETVDRMRELAQVVVPLINAEIDRRIPVPA